MMDITETLDGSLLTELKCVSCKNFLSVPPILIAQDGKNVCGRCSGDISADLKCVRNAFYEKLACTFRFPCSFVYEGCSVKKKFAEMKTHEEVCPYKTIKCRIKKCEWCGTFIEVINHYKKNHQMLVVQNDCVNELQKEDCYFMLVVDGFYFLLKWVRRDYKYYLKVENLNVLYLFDNEFHVNVFTVDSKFPLNILNSIKINENASLDMEILLDLPLFFSIKTQLPTDVINRKKADSTKIVCLYCVHQMVPPILKCHVGHITCVDCTTPYYDTCAGCDVDELSFTRVPELELVAQFSQYTCKWPNCNGNFSVRQIQVHEQNCPERIYECRHCIEWTGSVNDIISHDVVCTHRTYLRTVVMDTKVAVLGTDIKENINEKIEYWLIAFNEYFEIDFEPLAGGIDVLVFNYGLPSLFGWYCYEVDLQHVEDLNFPFNKTYAIKLKYSNMYTVLIPIADTAKFGGPKFYKLNVRIRLLCDTERISNMSLNFRMFK